jgi:catechol 2,3-dioxygenase-like lactoylglutathione lyase family enzyme
VRRIGVLGNSSVHPVLLSIDLAATRGFYHDKLGLEILLEIEHKIEFRCGGGTKLAVSKSTIGTADSQTQVGWEVDDLRAELDELRSRGVAIEDYDLPGLKTENGIADVGFGWMAWIVDPGKNALGIIQLKG